VNFLGKLDDVRYFSDVKYPIPMPSEIEAVLLSSGLLLLGSTTQLLFCPQKLKEFSEDKWVNELGKPRHIYLVESVKKLSAVMISLLFVSCGGVIALVLIGRRLLDAALYLI
jgi:hypothetical protein